MRTRNFAEWVTFGVASAIVMLVVGLILAEIPGENSPPSPTAEVTAEAEQRGDNFFVPVEVKNLGDTTAENVQVTASLEVEGEVFEADQVVDFLAGGESVELEWVFEKDPSSGTLKVRVSGYSVP